MVYAFLGLGFALLLIGSEAVLRGGAGLSRALGLPPFFASVLIVSLSMSAPELSVALHASARAMPDVVMGNIVGSAIANLLLVLGFGALLRPIPGPPRVVFRDGGTLIAAGVVLVVISLGGFIGKPLGGLLLAGWFAYVVLAYITDLGRPAHIFSDGNGAEEVRYGAPLSVFLFALGIICLYFGARLAIDFAILIARDFHLPRLAVALTLVALGTSLPEILSTVLSAGRGHPNGVAGQVIASSIFNILLVLGVAAVIRPLSVSPMIANFDAPIMTVCALLVAVLMLFGWRLTRAQGALLFLGYIAYVVSVGLRSGVHLPL